VKIAIAGPGRSGSSLLVQLFGAWGFGIPPADGNWHDDARSGLESRIGTDSPYEIDKDPWAFEYLERVDPDALSEYTALLVPIRNRIDASLSRSVQERVARATTLETDQWSWNSWGTVPGGAVVRTDASAISNTLSFGLWDLLETASKADVPIIILHFPRFATDFDYLWRNLSDIVGQRLTKAQARALWDQVVDTEKIRIGRANEADKSDLSTKEMHQIIEMLRQQERQALTQRDEALTQRDEALTQRDEALTQRDEALTQRDEALTQRDEALSVARAIQASRIWRVTAPYRRLRSSIRDH
jgi:hypothetical protein